MPVTRPTTTTPKAPGTLEAWERLMRTAIARAEAIGDRRLPGLRKALSEGRSERHLRGLGVICTADLEREFPSPK